MILIRRSTAADAIAIAAIQSGSGEAAQWIPGSSDEVRVAESDSCVAAFLVTRQVASEEYEILNLAVAPEHRRMGLARALLLHAFEHAPGEYFLEVRESNHPARQLYSGLGFEQAGVRKCYYSDPDEAAIVMRIRS